MAYQGTYDLSAIAEDITNDVVNGNWSYAIALIRSLNGLQALYVFNVIQQERMLESSHLNRLAMIASKSMNDGEKDEGYISQNQDTEEE